jgi:M6 family metalloprotease-like protein
MAQDLVVHKWSDLAITSAFADVDDAPMALLPGSLRLPLLAVAGTGALWAVGAALAPAAHAAPAEPSDRVVQQPGGVTFRGHQFGDEWAHGLETADGYTVLRGSDGVWRFAGRDREGFLAPTSRRAGYEPPVPGTSRHLRDDDAVPAPSGSPAARESGSAVDSVSGSSAGPTAPSASSPHTGTQKHLVILAQYADTPGTYLPATWNDRMFGAANSVRDYYQKASYGTFTLDPAAETSGTANDGIVGWVSIGATHPNPGQDTGDVNRAISSAAMAAANSTVNFAAFDTDNDGDVESHELHITVIVAGAEASYSPGFDCPSSVWGHNWALQTSVTLDAKSVGGFMTGGSYSQFGERHCGDAGDDHQATVGIMAHEIGHDLGMPDLYNTNDFNDPGAGDWTIMAGGSWGAADGADAGSSPAMLDPFLRSYEGWLTPTEVTTTPLTGHPLPSSYSTPSVLQLGANPNDVDWTFGNGEYDPDLDDFVPIPGVGEYFLVENRGNTGYDQGLPGCGVLVWHVDETRSTFSPNNDWTRRFVTVVPADDDMVYGDSGDPLPGTAGVTSLNDATTPSTKWYDGTTSGFGISVPAPGCADTASVDITTPAPPTMATLNVGKSGDGTGTVTSSAPGISCGADCSEQYALPASNVTLTAVASAGSTFTGWSGACTGTGTCSVPISAATTYGATAHFVNPPGAVITAPALVSDLTWKIVFDEKVDNVTTSTVRLRLTGSTAVPSTYVTCYDESNQPTWCGVPTGQSASLYPPTVRTAYIKLYATAVPGQSYDLTVGSGIKDVTGNLLPTVAKTGTKYLTAQAEAAPTAPAWGGAASASAIGGSYASERLAGSSARYYFSGSSVTWYTIMSPAQGKADVYIDGVKKTATPVNNYKSTTAYKVARTYTGLSTGQHMIEIRPLGVKGSTAATGTSVAIDAFAIGGGSCAAANSKCIATPGLSFNWSKLVSTTPAGTFIRSDQSGATAWLTFKGTKVTIYRLVGPTQGKMEIQLDSQTRVIVDNYRSTVGIVGYTLTASSTTPATHRLRVSAMRLKHASATGYFVSLDRFTVV